MPSDEGVPVLRFEQEENRRTPAEGVDHAQEIETLFIVKLMETTSQSRKAIAYLRTSSATNVGADKDSDKRQRAAIEAYAKLGRLEIIEELYDADVSGADPIEIRRAFLRCWIGSRATG